MQRREFLIGGAGAVTGIVVGRYAETLGRFVLRGDFEPSEVLRLDSWLAGLDGVAEVGERRLALAGETESGAGVVSAVADGDALARALGDRLRLDMSGPVRVELLERRLRDAIAEDFGERRICEVDGWQLSETECHVAAVRFVRGGTAEPLAPALREGRIVNVDGWGPRSTEVGKPFNVQRDGHSGLWFRAPGAPRWLQVVVDGDPMPTYVNEDVITSGVHGETMQRILAAAGRYPIEFLDEIAGVRQMVGDLEVRPAARPAPLASGDPSTALCVVEAWGPRETRAGVAVNPLHDGAIGLWLRTGCAPPGARLRAGPLELETTVRKDGRVTGRLPLAAVERPGALEISLHDPASGETLTVGTFVVRTQGR